MSDHRQNAAAQTDRYSLPVCLSTHTLLVECINLLSCGQRRATAPRKLRLLVQRCGELLHLPEPADLRHARQAAPPHTHVCESTGPRHIDEPNRGLHAWGGMFRCAGGGRQQQEAANGSSRQQQQQRWNCRAC